MDLLSPTRRGARSWTKDKPLLCIWGSCKLQIKIMRAILKPHSPTLSLHSALSLTLMGALSVGVVPRPAFAESRLLTLFPNEDVRLAPDTPFWGGQVTLPQTIVAPDDLPCHIRMPHLSLVTGALQVGTSCGIATGDHHALAWELFPEVGFAKSKHRARVRPALLIGLAGTFRLEPLEGQALFGSVHYKLAARDKTSLEAEFAAPKYNPFYLQKWADVFESNYALGWLREVEGAEGRRTGIRVTFKETLPLALRRAGALAESAAIEAKFIDVDVRRKSGRFLWGGGIGYAVVTFDAIRMGFPLPNLFVGWQW